MLDNGEFVVLKCYKYNETFLIKSISNIPNHYFDNFEMADFELSPSYIRKLKLKRLKKLNEKQGS